MSRRGSSTVEGGTASDNRYALRRAEARLGRQVQK